MTGATSETDERRGRMIPIRTSAREALLAAVVAALATLGIAQVAGAQSFAPSKLFDGTNGPELLQGTNERDTMRAFGGEDSVFGQGAGDSIVGGDGDDLLAGRSGDDVVLGSPGEDSISGGFGNDSLNGGPGGDSMFAGFGNDYVVVASSDGARDLVDCGPGVGDRVLADRGDRIEGCEVVEYASG